MVFPMTGMAAEWMNVGDIYTTSGTCLQAGTFIDKNGNELTLSEEEVEEILSSIEKPVPFTIDHNSAPIGYATKFSPRTGEYKGVINEQDAFNSSVLNGYHSVSPELDYEYDAYGNVIKKSLKRISFVKNPAMPGNTATVSHFAFSAPEVNRIMTDAQQAGTPPQQPPASTTMSWTNNPTNGTGYSTGSTTTAPYEWVQGQQIQKGAIAAPVSEPFAEVKAYEPDYSKLVDAITAKMEEKFAPLQAELDALKAQKQAEETPEDSAETPEVTEANKAIYDELAKSKAELQRLKEFNERVMKDEVTKVAAELKELGFENPEELVKSIPLENRVDALNHIKASYIKSVPMNSTNAQAPISAEGGTPTQRQVTVSSILESLHLDNSEYKKYAEELSKRLKIGV